MSGGGQSLNYLIHSASNGANGSAGVIVVMQV
jgi:hypothetical protein